MDYCAFKLVVLDDKNRPSDFLLREVLDLLKHNLDEAYLGYAFNENGISKGTFISWPTWKIDLQNFVNKTKIPFLFVEVIDTYDPFNYHVVVNFSCDKEPRDINLQLYTLEAMRIMKGKVV